MEVLAHKSGYKSVSDLHSNEISVLLKEFIINKCYMTWNKYSRDRFKFDVIIRNCKEGASPYLTEILEIIKEVSKPQNDLEMRFYKKLLIFMIFQLTF